MVQRGHVSLPAAGLAWGGEDVLRSPVTLLPLALVPFLLLEQPPDLALTLRGREVTCVG